jgi:ElaB/YqjD/DUF883 family membrane-anchored ribosome-binding protein
MATTTDMAPNRSASTTSTPRRSAANGARRASAASRAAAAASASREDELSDQISQLQSDMKAIAQTLAGLAEDKVNEAQSVAKREVKNVAKAGQQAVEEAQDEFNQLERQIKDTIREKPLTAVAGAIALGYILAIVSR